MWQEGNIKDATPLLLALEDDAKLYSKINGISHLYRGFLIKKNHQDELNSDGYFTIITAPERQLASWSYDKKFVISFMHGWERPWVLIKKPIDNLSIFINVEDAFSDICDVEQRYPEIIVKMPPKMIIHQSDLVSNEDGQLIWN